MEGQESEGLRESMALSIALTTISRRNSTSTRIRCTDLISFKCINSDLIKVVLSLTSESFAAFAVLFAIEGLNQLAIYPILPYYIEWTLKFDDNIAPKS